LSIIYDGFLGLELPYLKIPTLTCAKWGFSYMPEANLTISNKEDYFNRLDNLEQVIDDFYKNYEKFIPYYINFFYWYLFENLIKIPTLKYYYEAGPQYLHLTLEDFILEDQLKELFSIEIP